MHPTKSTGILISLGVVAACVVPVIAGQTAAPPKAKTTTSAPGTAKPAATTTAAGATKTKPAVNVKADEKTKVKGTATTAATPAKGTPVTSATHAKGTPATSATPAKGAPATTAMPAKGTTATPAKGTPAASATPAKSAAPKKAEPAKTDVKVTDKPKPTASTSGSPADGWTPNNPVAEQLAGKVKIQSKVKAVLPPNCDLNNATAGFNNLGQFIAAVHVSENLRIPFGDLKSAMTGVNLDGKPAGRGSSLGGAIRLLKGDVDPTAEAQRGVAQAEAELAETPATRPPTATVPRTASAAPSGSSTKAAANSSAAARTKTTASSTTPAATQTARASR